MELAAVGRDEFVQGFKLAGVRKTFSVARDQLEAQVAKVLEDANVRPAHPLAQVPFPERDPASVCLGYRQREYS